MNIYMNTHAPDLTPGLSIPPLHEWRGGIDRFIWIGGLFTLGVAGGYSRQPLTGCVYDISYMLHVYYVLYTCYKH